jgi:agarase
MKITAPHTLLLALSLSGPALAQGGLELSDDFSRYAAGSDGAPHWEPGTILWEVREGEYRVDGSLGGFAVPAGDAVYPRLSVEAVLRVSEAVGTRWKIAGVAVYRDARNFWHFALIESPDDAGKKHFVELVQMRDGRWLSQDNLRLALGEGQDFDWQYNRPYRLRIAMTPEGIEGALTELDGTVRSRGRYEFSDVAVTTGRPALRVGGFVAAWDDVRARGTGGIKLEEPTRTHPAYDVPALGKLRFRATGFFRTRRRDGVWWVVDPRGRAFYAVGTDHCRYEGHWCEKLGYAPHGKVTERKYGTRERWAEAATDRLKAWGFNLLGAGNDPAAWYRGLAHTVFAAFGSTFSSLDDIAPKVHWTGFPNVFSPRWEAYCDQRARKQCEPHRHDPWLFGYFLDNELEWYGKTHTEWGLFDEAMKKPADHTAKQAAIGLLRDRYETIAALNRAWGTEVESWDAMGDLEALDGDNSDQVRRDKVEFVRLVADRYFVATTAAIRKHDPNHMIIGCRFAGRAPAGIWDIAGKYCDIVTFNYYGRVDLERQEAPGLAERFAEYHEQAGKPLMITEWSFPALDSGLPCRHGAGQRFDTQEQRARAFEVFQTMVFRLPFMVGSDYFMWVDEPALGISSTFPEDTNYGLISEGDEPYPELTAACARLNPQVYDIHRQQFPDLALSGLDWRKGEASVRVRNAGRAAAGCKLVFSGGGARAQVDIALRPGRQRTLEARLPLEGACALLVAEADPEGELSDPHRADNRATKLVYAPPEGWALAEARARAPILVANESAEAVGPAPLTLRLGQLGARDWAAVGRGTLALLAADGGEVMFQLDPADGPLSRDSELCFEAPELGPGEAAALFLYLCRRPLRRAEPANAIELEESPGGFTARVGPLSLRKHEPGGDFIDELRLGDITLGRYNPLIWQSPGQDKWVRTARFEGARVSNGPVRAVMDCAATGGNQDVITAVDDAGRQAARSSEAVPFRVRHRLALYPGRPWFAARFLSVENLGRRELNLRGYFFYLLPSIGGSPEGDRPAGPDVPNYYAQVGAAWADEAAGAAYGIFPDRERRIRVNFWLDEGGGFHADARYQFEETVTVAPGEVFALPDAPYVHVYGTRNVNRPWVDAMADLSGLHGLRVEPAPEETR